MNNIHEFQKIIAFGKSIEKYLNNPLYKKMELINSFLVISLQILSSITLLYTSERLEPLILILTFVCAYVAADFINGLVHMFMDNNTAYSSIVGPFIAAFHMHHANPGYRNRHPLQIYFFESGTKFWLSGFLLLLVALQKHLPFSIHSGLVFFGILSSLAEVSHYWCHMASSKNRIILRLQKYRILLSKKHHSNHHRLDNMQYAFLNGISDPLINKISGWFYPGYKNHADRHTQAWLEKQRSIAE